MPVVIGSGSHPFPFRTRKLSLIPPMVLHGKLCGRVGRCRHYSTTRPDVSNHAGPFLLHTPIAPAYIGCAGWNIPRLHRGRFAEDGSQLQRYSTRLNASRSKTRRSIVRTRARSTNAGPPACPSRFASPLKIPKPISQERALTRAREPLRPFQGEIAGLG